MLLVFVHAFSIMHLKTVSFCSSSSDDENLIRHSVSRIPTALAIAVSQVMGKWDSALVDRNLGRHVAQTAILSSVVQYQPVNISLEGVHPDAVCS